MIANPIGIGLRIAALVQRYQNVSSGGCGNGSHRPNSRRASVRTSAESSRAPSSTIIAGVTIRAAVAAKTTTATPAYAKDFRKKIGNNAIATIDNATVTAENSTVRPAVTIVRTRASSGAAPLAR